MQSLIVKTFLKYRNNHTEVKKKRADITKEVLNVVLILGSTSVIATLLYFTNVVKDKTRKKRRQINSAVIIVASLFMRFT